MCDNKIIITACKYVDIKYLWNNFVLFNSSQWLYAHGTFIVTELEVFHMKTRYLYAYITGHLQNIYIDHSMEFYFLSANTDKGFNL